ncbi:MAG: ABC transporter permease [Bacilli bacterium]|nr:ABC transporter permease [Bacilli bacterium]
MKDIFTVIKFTMKDMIKRKSFIISTIVILVMIFIGFNVPNIIKSFKDDSVKTKMLISDINNVYENKLSQLNNIDLGYNFSFENIGIDSIKEKILAKDIDCGVYIERKDNTVNLTYVVENATFGNSPGELFTETLTSLYKNMQIEKLGLSQEQMLQINPKFNYEISQAEEEAKGNVLAMMIMSILLFYAIYFCAYQVSSSITTEKTSKIIETLVTSTSPRNIVLGKTIGIGLVGLCQMVLFLVTAVICANLFIEKELLESILDLSTITVGLGFITILYFLLGYFAYALLYALTGSTVSKPEDINSANTPVALLTVVAFYLSYFTMMNPASELNSFAALFPLSSPFCMPFRIMMGFATSSEVLLSIAILLITILIIASVTIKIYSNAILNYGSKLSIKDIIKMYKQK